MKVGRAYGGDIGREILSNRVEDEGAEVESNRGRENRASVLVGSFSRSNS